MNNYEFKKFNNPKRIKQSFKKNGFVVLRNFLKKKELHDLKIDILNLLKIKKKYSNLRFKTAEDIDYYLKKIWFKDRNILRQLMHQIRDLPSFYNFITNKKLLGISKLLLGSKMIDACHDACMIRIDTKHDTKRKWDWHQDYSYILGSFPGITGWIPLKDIHHDMGPVKLIPCSHKNISKVKIKDNKILPLNLKDLKLKNKKIYETEILQGDVLLFDGLCWHASGNNLNDNNARWVVLPRYSDPSEQKFAKSGWLRSRENSNQVDIFKSRHKKFY